MALVTDGWELTIQLADTSGSISSLTYNLIAADQAAATTATADIIAALNAVTDSVIANYRLAEVFVEDAFALPADAENRIKASMTVTLAGLGQKKAVIRIPAPVDGVFVAPTGPGYDEVDGSAAIVQTYVDLFKADPTGVATLSDGEHVSADTTINGARTTQTSRR